MNAAMATTTAINHGLTLGLALALGGWPPFSKGAQPWQSVAKLVKLRNALIHYEPEWVPVPTAAGEEHSFEKQFAGTFSLNPLAPDENPFYPDKILGHGCAAWAIKSSMAFMDSFKDKAGLFLGLYGGKDDPELSVE